MNIDKHIKPKLVDPHIRQKIIKTIKPSKVNYWEPTKNVAQYFYEDYIRPNLISVILIGIFIFILIYRYSINEKNKLLRKLDKDSYTHAKNPDLDMAMLLYNYQKELALEPKYNSEKNKISYPIYPYVNNH